MSRFKPGRWTRRLATGLLFLFSFSAWAEDYYVESPSTADRSHAEAQLEGLPSLGAGIQPRVIRRFQVGEGWAYVIRVDALEQDQAQGVADALSQGSQRGVVYRRIGSRTVRVMDEVAGGEGTTPPALPASRPAHSPAALDLQAAMESESSEPVIKAVPPPDEDEEFEPRLRSAESILKRAVRAHGGEAGGFLQIEGAGSVHFAYERTVATDEGTLLVKHDFIRLGEGLRLEVEVLQGNGMDSLAVVDRSGEAWVVVDGEKTGRDAERTSGVLRTFGPGEILGISMHIAEKVRIDDRLQSMVLVGNEANPGGERVVLRAPDGAGRGLEEVAFDAAQAWLVSATWSSLEGTIRMGFEEYTVSDNGLVYPARMTVWRDGELTERILVHQLQLNQTVDSSLFDVPDSASPE